MTAADAVIRPTTLADIRNLPDVEQSAAESFRSIPDLVKVADDPLTSVEEHQELVLAGTSWVAVCGDVPIGFLCAEVVDTELHVWELSVRQEHQGHGLGRRLVAAAIAFARQRRLAAVTLTTFLGVPWNEPFYRRMGFLRLPAADVGSRLAGILAAEVAHGLPAEQRCAMRLPLDECSLPVTRG